MERSGMRAADADREATAERLRVALEEGRLSLHEYDERLGRTYGAKTYAELDEVLVDLPGTTPVERSAVVPAPPAPSPTAAAPPHPAAASAPAPTPPDAAPVRPSAGPRRGSHLLGLWMSWLRVAAVLVPIWLLSSLGARDFGNFWPAWVLGPWGALLLMQWVGLIGGVHGSGPGRDARRYRGRDRRRRGRA
ncbi:DUF1707 domain-containing protein [Micromonospora sp. NPDC049836]|uniref:DUF1707 domain-containing protein n=1 Tax=Micromonospora sp. NPDC049836 TaxID=3364274 RepID=UPI00379BD79A